MKSYVKSKGIVQSIVAGYFFWLDYQADAAIPGKWQGTGRRLRQAVTISDRYYIAQQKHRCQLEKHSGILKSSGRSGNRQDS